MSCAFNCQCNNVTVGVSMAKLKRQFMFSGFAAKDDIYLSEIQDKVKKLKGIIIDGKIYHTECTHLICYELVRTEKTLGALAAGKWILTPEYVTESEKCGKWLNEEQYEWKEGCQAGMPSSYTEAPKLNREYVKQTKHGLFFNYKVAVVLKDADKKSAFERLLVAGQAKVVYLKLPISSRNRILPSLTHIFCEKDMLRSLEFLKERCYHPDFITNYLFRRRNVVEADFRTITYEPTKNPLSILGKINNGGLLKKQDPINSRGEKRKTKNVSKPVKKIVLEIEKLDLTKVGSIEKFVHIQKTEIEESRIEDHYDKICMNLVNQMFDSQELLADLFDGSNLSCDILFEKKINCKKMNSEELSENYSFLLSKFVEIDRVTWLQSLVNEINYPSADIMGQLLWLYILKGEDGHLVEETSRLVHIILTLHPPSSKKMQTYYQQILCYSMTDGCEMNPFNGWKNILQIISLCQIDDEILQAKKNHHYVMNIIVRILEYDLAHVGNHCTNLQEIPLIFRLVWPDYKPNYINNAVVNLLKAIFVHSFFKQSTQFSIVDSSFKLLSILGICCQVYNQKTCTSSFGKIHLPLKLSDLARELSRSIARHIQDGNFDCELINLIFSFLPTWLTVGVTDSILDCISESSSSPVLSLTKVHSVHLSTKEIRLDKSAAVTFVDVSKESKVAQESPLQRSAEKQSPTRRSNAVSSFNINKRNFKGETPLHLACIRSNHTKVKELLNCPGIDVNSKDNAGWTPLHEAANHGALECVRELLAFKPKKTLVNYFKSVRSTNSDLNIFAVGLHDYTALHDAVANGYVEVAQLLSQRGGQKLLNMKTTEGWTAMDLATSQEMKNALEKPLTRRKLFPRECKIEALQVFTGSNSSVQSGSDDTPVHIDFGIQFAAVYHFVISFCSFNRLSQIHNVLKEKCLNPEFATPAYKNKLWPMVEYGQLQKIISQLKNINNVRDKDKEALNTFLDLLIYL